MAKNHSWDPERYAQHARFVSDLGMPVVELLAPAPGERILDLGCGDGALTEKLAAMGCRVVGIDSSAAQIEAARKRGLDAYVMDGQRLTFQDEFDAVFSNAALHWMTRADGVIAEVWRALKPAAVDRAGVRGQVHRAGAPADISAGRHRRMARGICVRLHHHGPGGRALRLRRRSPRRPAP